MSHVIVIPAEAGIHLLLWVGLLWRYSRLRLRLRLTLYAAHPDGRGGLGFLGFAQAAFAAMPLVGIVLLCGSLTMEIEYLDVTLNSLHYVLLGYVVIALAVMVAPLLPLVMPVDEILDKLLTSMV